MVMNRLETLLASNQYRDVASLLESLDGPLADEVWNRLMTLSAADHAVSLNSLVVQPENVQLWLYLVLGHLYNHQWCGLGALSSHPSILLQWHFLERRQTTSHHHVACITCYLLTEVRSCSPGTVVVKSINTI